MFMLPKVLGFMNSLTVPPTTPVTSEGAQKIGSPKQNFFVNGPTTSAGAYDQYDRGLEHGYGGAQYRDGAIIGKRLNIEW